jgi:hypothetical protein
VGVASELIHIKDKVGNLLEEFPASRDDDKLLWLLYLRRFCNLPDEGWDILHNILAKDSTPAMESIRRIRQKFQENGNYVGEKRQKRLEESEAVVENLRDF